MYHRQVSSSPRPVRAIMSSSEAPAPGASRIRLSIAGVAGSADSRAEWRVWVSAASTPSLIHSVGASGSPLSNTEDLRLEEGATTNGEHCRPGAPGAPRSVTGTLASRSPTRVPPPGLLNTVRPSSASLAPADQYM